MPTLEQLQEAVQRDRAETLSTEAARREQAARRKRELEELDARMEREWYSDDPQWQAAHRSVDEARDEQLAARRYQEQRERGQKAYDLSTQAALDEKFARRENLANKPVGGYTEKEENTRRFWENFLNNDSFYSPHQDLLESRQRRDAAQHRTEMAEDASTQGAMDEKLAERRYWNSFAAEEYAKDNESHKQSGVLYNEHTGEIFIPARKDNEPSGWEAYSMDGKIHVDPKVERRFSLLSNGISAVFAGAASAVTKKPTVMMLQPVIANLIEAGLLRKEYGTEEYILNNPHTNEVGISISGAFGAHASGSIGVATDCYGNIGIVISGGGGAGTPSASAGMYSAITNAPQIDYLRGTSTQVGGSVAVGPPAAKMSAGVDVMGFYCPQTGETYYGISTNVGVTVTPAFAPISAEMHGNISTSFVLDLKKLWENLLFGSPASSGVNRCISLVC